VNSTIVHRASLDRAALPPADTFFRQNVEHYRRYGRRARGVCPFHRSSRGGRIIKTPFAMNLDRGLFHCFSCGAGGDIIEFVKVRDGIDFITAAKKLGVLQPLDREEAQHWRREKEAREAKRQAKIDAYCCELEILLHTMEVAEWLRDFGFRLRDDELQDLAERHIVRTGADFVLLKAEAGVTV
jgi:hypothetical protein